MRILTKERRTASVYLCESVLNVLQSQHGGNRKQHFCRPIEAALQGDSFCPIPSHQPAVEVFSVPACVRVFVCHKLVIDGTPTCLAAFPVSGESSSKVVSHTNTHKLREY